MKILPSRVTKGNINTFVMNTIYKYLRIILFKPGIYYEGIIFVELAVN